MSNSVQWRAVNNQASVACRSLLIAALTVAALNGTDINTPGRASYVRVAPIYVPLDSWVYPALKRLAALGYTPDAETLVTPWTRQECEMLVEEAEDIVSRHSTKISAGRANDEAQRLIAELKIEFPDSTRRPKAEARVESAYVRTVDVSGTPLRDSYHFGQTIVNDFGRPYEPGANSADGFSAYGTFGRFGAYFRGEYQGAPASGGYSQPVQNLIGALDGVPPMQAKSVSSIGRFDPLEMYVGTQLGAWNVTFGKQSLWWGPGTDSAFAFSNNAEPMYALNLSQRTPFVLPGPFRYLGHIRTQFMIGKFAGNTSPPRPFLNAQKITFQLSENLEVGFTRSSIFGGVGHPLTTGSFLRSLVSFSSSGSLVYGTSNDPGDRRSGFDFQWRVPGLRRFVTIYSDSLADDEPNPLDSPRRSAWAPGIYFPRVLGTSKLDLRFETYSTWLYAKDQGGQFIYWNNQYRDAYTNDGNLIGSWVGRDARTYQGSSTYWWSAKDKLTLSFRQTKTGDRFLPGGGTQTDVSASTDWAIRPDLLANVFVQFERYFVPVLGGPRRDVSAGLQFTFYPRGWSLAR